MEFNESTDTSWWNTNLYVATNAIAINRPRVFQIPSIAFDSIHVPIMHAYETSSHRWLRAPRHDVMHAHKELWAT